MEKNNLALFKHYEKKIYVQKNNIYEYLLQCNPCTLFSQFQKNLNFCVNFLENIATSRWHTYGKLFSNYVNKTE
jgi:hypothetical protein